MSDSHLIETATARDQLVKGNFLDVRRDTVRLPDGGSATREYIVHPGAVTIVPILDDGRLVLERQFRYPVDQVILEFPAGKVDPGEDRLRTAQRELLEETGYHAAEWAFAARLHNAVAYSTEAIEIYFARGLTLGDRRLDEGEFLDVVICDEAELEQLAARGELTDAKTLIALLWLQKWRAGLWHLSWQRTETVAAPQ